MAEQTSSKQFTIYSKSNCQWCTKAKAQLNIAQIQYKELLLDRDFDRDFIVNKFPQMKTFPIIVDEAGKLIGGSDSLQEYLSGRKKL